MARHPTHDSEEDGLGLPSPYDDAPGEDADLWFLPQQDGDDAQAPPLPRADHRPLLDPAPWLSAQADHAADLADAAMAVGRLDEVAASLGPGAVTRLAMAEIEAMLWSAGTPVPREDIGRDMTALRGDRDLAALRLARWGLRRLQGQGDLRDLRGFLMLQRAELPGLDDAVAPRLQGQAFDDAAQGFALAMDDIAGAHPLTRGAWARLAWRLSDLSPDEDVTEAAIWAARSMAETCGTLPFVPLGMFGRRVWRQATPDRLGDHFRAVTDGATAARLELNRLHHWAARARAATARIKGDNPARVIDALLARPIALTAAVEQDAGISRDTAERLLARMADMGLVREVTGARRFRLWAAAA